MDSVNESAIERSVRLHVVSARVVVTASRAEEPRRRDETVGFIAQVEVKAVGGRVAKQVLEYLHIIPRGGTRDTLK